MRRVVLGLILGLIYSITAHAAYADGPAPAFEKGLSDCIAVVTDPSLPFANADEANGDWDMGFVAWYNDANGEPAFGVRAGRADSGGEDVYGCSAPFAMGPVDVDYAAHDRAIVLALFEDLGLVELVIPAEGDFYADCMADTDQAVLVAIQFDETRRAGFQVVKAASVIDSCTQYAVGS